MRKNFGVIHRPRHDSIIKVGIVASLAVLFVSLTMLMLIMNVPTDEATAKGHDAVVERDPSIEMVKVLVPIQSIDSGAQLDAAMFRVEERPKVTVTDSSVQDFEIIQGKFARSLIVANQPLHLDYVTDQRPINQITALIPEGYRAVTIPVDVRTGIEGWARPGARVDVAWNTTIRGKPAVAIIVENAKVLSASRSTENSKQANTEAPIPTELTLLVSIKDANKIILAQKSGSLALSLRGDSEPGKTEAGGAITVDDLLGTNRGIKARTVSNENIVRIKDNNGVYEEFALVNGRLTPLNELEAESSTQ